MSKKDKTPKQREKTKEEKPLSEEEILPMDEQEMRNEEQAGREDSSPKEETELSSEEKVRLLAEENSKMKENTLRMQADYENARKRLVREKQEAVRFANQQLLGDLIEILDNFERALASAKDSDDFQAFHEGIAITENQFYSMLKNNWGLDRIECVSKPFDPSCQRAMMMEDSTEVDEMTVAEELQTGYMIHDRVLRPALVKVFKPAAESDEIKPE